MCNKNLFVLFFTLIAYSTNLISIRPPLDNGVINDYNRGVDYFKANDLEKAKYYFSLAADCGMREAQYNLGYIYWQENDLRQAKHYFYLAFRNGQVEAQNGLGERSMKKKVI